MDIGEWLGNLGLERYNAAFRENAIDTDVLRDLTDQDLEKLGVLLGDRRRLLRAIAALDDGSAAASSPTPVKSPVTMPLISAAAASPTSSTVEVSGELIDTAGASFGELPQFAEQQVSAPTTEMVATQQRQIHGPVVTEGTGPELKNVPRAPSGNGIVPARGDGHSMTYHQLITRAVDELDSNTEEARRALYERARTALLAQLRSNKHVLVLADITRQRRALEEAIGKVEADAARKLRVETQELRSAAPPGRTPNGGAQVSSAPPRRERANRPLAALPEDGWPAVLFSARERLLSVRSSQRRQTASGLREGVGVGDGHGPGTPETAAAKTARQTPETYELITPQSAWAKPSSEPRSDADDLQPIDYDTRQQCGLELDPEDEPATLPAQDTLRAPEVEEEQKDPSSNERYRGAVSRPNWSRPLPKLLIVSGVLRVATLNDVRVMIERHLPVPSRAGEMWGYVSNELREAALGGDTAEFFSVLEMALSIEGLEWALK
ncbi:MAG TPA: SAM domain-containing protein [Stellaceae bacterium]|nr:SAM domain-containing protein [Stellaceae bacterium]